MLKGITKQYVLNIFGISVHGPTYTRLSLRVGHRSKIHGYCPNRATPNICTFPAKKGELTHETVVIQQLNWRINMAGLGHILGSLFL